MFLGQCVFKKDCYRSGLPMITFLMTFFEMFVTEKPVSSNYIYIFQYGFAG